MTLGFDHPKYRKEKCQRKKNEGYNKNMRMCKLIINSKKRNLKNI